MPAAIEILACESAGAVVVDDHDAKVVWPQLSLDAGDGLTQKVDRIARGDDHGDGWSSDDRTTHVVRTFPGAIDNRPDVSAPVEAILQAANCRGVRLRLGNGASGD